MDCNQLTVQLLLVLSVNFGVLAGVAKLKCDSPETDLCRQQAIATCWANDEKIEIYKISVYYGEERASFDIGNKKMQQRNGSVSVSLEGLAVTVTLFSLNKHEKKSLPINIQIFTQQGNPKDSFYLPKDHVSEATKELSCDDPEVDRCHLTATVRCKTNERIGNGSINWRLNGKNHSIYIDAKNMSAEDGNISVEAKDNQLILNISDIKIYNNTILSVQINSPAIGQSCGIALRSRHFEEDCKAKADKSTSTPEPQGGQTYIEIFIPLALVLALVAAALGYWLYHKKQKAFSPGSRERSQSQGPLIEDGQAGSAQTQYPDMNGSLSSNEIIFPRPPALTATESPRLQGKFLPPI